MLLQFTVISVDVLITTDFIGHVWLVGISVPEPLGSLRSKNSCLCLWREKRFVSGMVSEMKFHLGGKS